ncbi:MAG: hypothetical protein HY365_01225 [Candidatus Aenigmarchaeota archaeon]|nr:hypothetical protein [Candidatus Aenigmarchaeota archaeon]
MKGMVMMLVAMLLVTSIMIIAAFSPINRNAAEAARTAAKSYASEISGAINIMQATPGDVSYDYQNMPDGDCTINIGRQVTVNLGKKGMASVGIIESAANRIIPAELECGKIKGIRLTKQGGVISAKGV